MSSYGAAYGNKNLIGVAFLTALQLFIAAKLFNALNEYYGVMMLFNSAVLPVWFGVMNPRSLNNLIPLFKQVMYASIVGFIVSGVLSKIVPRSFIEGTPLFLEVLSTLVAVCATLPASILPFAASLVMVGLLSGARKLKS